MNDESNFPIHDAKLIGVYISQISSGDLHVLLELEIHQDEVELLQPFGLFTGGCRLVFESCWQIDGRLYGYFTPGETIDRWEIESPNSEDTSRAQVAPRKFLKLHRFVLSGGSTLELITNRFRIESRR